MEGAVTTGMPSGVEVKGRMVFFSRAVERLKDALPHSKETSVTSSVKEIDRIKSPQYGRVAVHLEEVGVFFSVQCSAETA